ncbi:MAG: HAD family phosphatase [Thermodesulfobacteriota bacterium]
MIKAVIFDMDGVMIDSEPLWEKTERILLKRRGIEYTADYRDQIVGLNQNDSGKLLVETFNLKDSVEEIIDERVVILTGIYEEELEVVKELIPLLNQLQDLDYKLAVASSSPLRVINFVLDMFSLHQYFPVVVSGECTDDGKPHPAIYLHTAKRLEIDPSECVAIEDSINGVKSAKAAGMHCIAVPDKRLTQDQFKIADLIVPSLNRISPDLIKFFD